LNLKATYNEFEGNENVEDISPDDDFEQNLDDPPTSSQAYSSKNSLSQT
jgi:hypothetical protein